MASKKWKLYKKVKPKGGKKSKFALFAEKGGLIKKKGCVKPGEVLVKGECIPKSQIRTGKKKGMNPPKRD